MFDQDQKIENTFFNEKLCPCFLSCGGHFILLLVLLVLSILAGVEDQASQVLNK